MNQQEIIQKLSSDTNSKVKFAVCDIDGILRSKMIYLNKLGKNLQKDIPFCDVIFGWDVNDECYSSADFTGWHTGYPDKNCHLDLSTFRQIPWDNQTIFFLADFSQNKTFIPCPRTLLKKIINRSHTMGYTPMFGTEFEWMNFKRMNQSQSENNTQTPIPITNGMFGYSQVRPIQYSAFFNDLFDLLPQFQIPLESIHTETGPGVYEAAIVYDQALQAADKAVLFKSSVKEIGLQHDITSSFIARWNDQLPGCGGHLHQSLQNIANQTNIFGNSENSKNPNQLTSWYIAGILHCLPEVLPMYAPTINSYKRLKSGSWAPTTASWGTDNRTVAVRYIPGESNRIELRVPGADINPYLAIAASLASGLYGIQHQLQLPPESKGNAYQGNETPLPDDLQEATHRMKTSVLAKELFGEAFVSHFCMTREWEWAKFSKAVTNWELNRYLEII